MKKTGILGGTFDPIHYGHLLLAQTALEQFALDEVMLIPAAQPPHKMDHPITPAHIRLEMTQVAVAGNERLVCSDFELARPGNSYTYQTLRLLRASEPDTAFYFIMGADSLRDFDTWRHPESIARDCVMLVAVRRADAEPTDSILAQMAHVRQTYGADVRLLSFSPIALSSSAMRARVAQGCSVRYMTPDNVCAIIEREGLYKRGLSFGNRE